MCVLSEMVVYTSSCIAKVSVYKDIAFLPIKLEYRSAYWLLHV